jgi:CheY-like chemotaxis protein
MKISLPVFRYPTLIVLVDDSASFVVSLEFQMNPMVAVKSFQHANDALYWIETAHRNSDRKLPIRTAYDDQTLSMDRRMVALDVDEIYRIAMNPLRFREPAVIVVDYAMQQMNGVDFCRALKGLPCKKILFTGEADETIAVAAFNAGLIDCYLKKSDPQSLDRLEIEIAALENRYFTEKSEMLRELLVGHSFSFLSDPLFAELIGKLSVQYGFVEYFLFPNPAGMLFIDADGVPALMVVETSAGITAHLEAAQEYGAPQALKDALRDEAIVPYFWKSGGMYGELSRDWEQYCQPAQRWIGREDYLWALFALPDCYLDQPVYPYNRFLMDLVQRPDPWKHAFQN